MNVMSTLAAGPGGIGGQEVVMIFLIIGILAGPVILALAILVFALGRHRRKMAAPPPTEGEHGAQR